MEVLKKKYKNLKLKISESYYNQILSVCKSKDTLKPQKREEHRLV